MKRIIITACVAVGALLTAYLGLRIFWHSKEVRVLNVFILNKSVADLSAPEHKSFVWILNHNRYTQQDQSPYSYRDNYYGFIPLDAQLTAFDFRSIRMSEVDDSAASFDMAYFVDCYGLYSFEWYKSESRPQRNQQLYGGLNHNDYLLMKRMLELGKLVIAERNMFSSPTNALVREKTEELLGIGWSGWSGKYFETLQPDAPNGPPLWMKSLYESQHMGVWPADRSGIVLISNDGLIDVLTHPEHLESGMPILTVTKAAGMRFGIERPVPFDGWLEFIDPKENLVQAHFTLNTTELGTQALARLRLLPTLPAVIEGSGSSRFFYLCGDFAGNPVQMWTSRIAMGQAINSLLHRRGQASRSAFFQHFYTPMMESIIDEYYVSIQGKN